MPDKPKHLYHYTSVKAAKAIAQTGYIKASTNVKHDAALGVGAYFTSKPPQTSTHNLFVNNYGAVGHHKPSDAKAYVRIPANEVSARNGKNSLDGRDVYLVPGRAVPLPTGSKIGIRQGR